MRNTKLIRLDTIHGPARGVFIRAVGNKNKVSRDLYFFIETDSVSGAYDRVKKLLPMANLFVVKFDEIKELERQKKFDAVHHCEDFGENSPPLFGE